MRMDASGAGAPPADSFDDPAHLGRILLRRVLPLVSAPGRYVGGELGADRDGWAPAAPTSCWPFPTPTRWACPTRACASCIRCCSGTAGAFCDLAFAPWPDMEQVMRAEGLPLFGLEIRRPARHFDLIGFSLGYELAYTNLLTMIDLAGSPLLAAERGEGDPIFVAGGSCVMNPAVVGPFLDLVVLGDGEEVVLDFAGIIADRKAAGAVPRRASWSELRTVAGRLARGRRASGPHPRPAGPERLSAARPAGAGDRAGA